MKKKILITGAAGFIGFHLVRKLIMEDFEIVGIDNINDYYDPELKFARLNECGIGREEIDFGKEVKSKTHPNYTFMRLDICDRQGISQLFEEQNFYRVIHLAAQAGARYSIKDPYSYINSNILGFANLIEEAGNRKIDHFIYASSSSVYGLNNKVPYSTDDRVDQPVSLYAATKRSNELIAYTYSYIHGLRTTGLRFFTVYGPWGRPDMAYHIFTEAILKNKPIKVYNNGKLSRDFTYVDDIIEGMTRIILDQYAEGINTSEKYNLYNIGSSNPINLLEFIETLETKLGRKAGKEFMEMQAGDVETTYADMSDYNTKFISCIHKNIDKGLDQYIHWFKAYYDFNSL